MQAGRVCLLCQTLALVGLGSVVQADAPARPFLAWLDHDSAFIREEASSSAPIVGLLQRGDVVQVTGCVPSCEAPNAWALLGGNGAIRLSLLNRTPEGEDHLAQSASARYVYGVVLVEGMRLYEKPGGRVLESLKAGRALAFRPQPSRFGPEWLDCAEGGIVRASGIRLARPSTFTGAHALPLPVAFALRRTVLSPPAEVAQPPARVPRYARWPVKELDGSKVRTPAGSLPRRDVRLALPVHRPPGVQPDEKWVHVDLTEQTLTAYEGDHPVFTTLVSTGKTDHETPRGLFKVWLKAVRHKMTGPPDDPYEVDEVPFTLFFRRGDALHGAFWHDAFGSVVSHGCVNLSVGDAEWLFNWAPPELPQGWHAAIPGPSEQASLKVLIDRSAPVRHWKPAPAAAPETAQGRADARELTPAPGR